MTATLECDHCGCDAFTGEDGDWIDGAGGKCETCGFPGVVSVDEDREVWWNMSQDKSARCTLPSCDECKTGT